jgi:hypothetical protein
MICYTNDEMIRTLASMELKCEEKRLSFLVSGLSMSAIGLFRQTKDASLPFPVERDVI